MNAILIGEGWVTHGRPSKPENAFKYSIFNLLIPINSSTSAILKNTFNKHSALNFLSCNYLDGQEGDISQLICSFLKNNLQYEAEDIWLQTLPRMWGYGFNPVSFWFCYKNKSLDAVLCEVNNTFGDRHFYFLKDFHNKNSKTTVLKKNFHVSPFFPVTGNYEFTIHKDPQVSDISINLIDENGQTNLKTRIYLNLSAFEPISKWYLLRKYGWFSIMVIVRIHWQALRLWKNKIPFFSRPAPPKEKITL